MFSPYCNRPQKQYSGSQKTPVCLVALLRLNGPPKRAAAIGIAIASTNIQLVLTHVLAIARPADDAQ